MIRIVSWNINRQKEPWRELAGMARRGEADVALLQEAANPPGDLENAFSFEKDVFWDRCTFRDEDNIAWEPPSCDRWPLVVKLSDRVEVEWFRQVPPSGGLGEHDVATSCIGTMAAARVTPRGRPEEAFVTVSMYARWMRALAITRKNPGEYADISAHRILSDIQAFIDDLDPSRYRILAAGDLNMFYGATGYELSWPCRERTVWDRFDALGLEFLGPQLPNGREATSAQPDVPGDTRNVPTYHKRKQKPAEANRQLDYVFASRGLHEHVRVRALNGVEEWGSSDHCRLLIEVGA